MIWSFQHCFPLALGIQSFCCQDFLVFQNSGYDDIISWADMYDSASTESKKMIVSCLIRRVEVYRDYRLHIDFNIDFEQFSAGLDISAIAA